MHTSDAQLEMGTRFVGGFYGQLVSGVLWLAPAAAVGRLSVPHEHSAVTRPGSVKPVPGT